MTLRNMRLERRRDTETHCVYATGSTSGKHDPRGDQGKAVVNVDKGADAFQISKK